MIVVRQKDAEAFVGTINKSKIGHGNECEIIPKKYDFIGDSWGHDDLTWKYYA